MRALKRGIRLNGYVALGCSIVTLGTGSTVVRKIGGDGAAIACYRSFIAAILWQLWLGTQGRRLTWAAVRRMGLIGLLFGANLAAFFIGITKTSIANAEFSAALMPVVLIPIGAKLFGERIPWPALPWGLGALTGVAIILLNAPPRGSATWSGNLIVGLALVLWAAYQVTLKRMVHDLDVAEFMATNTLIAGVVLLPYVLLTGEAGGIPARGVPWLVLMAVSNGMFAHGMLVIAQRQLPMGTISTVQLAQPAIATACAAVFLDESVTGMQVLGIALVLASLFAYTRIAQRFRTAASGR